MKLFATSDIHGNRRIMDKLPAVAPETDLILICGDIGGKDGRGLTFRQFSERQRGDADYLRDVLGSLGTESRFILGNDDWFEYEDRRYMRQPEVIGGLTFIPFEYVLLTPLQHQPGGQRQQAALRAGQAPRRQQHRRGGSHAAAEGRGHSV